MANVRKKSASRGAPGRKLSARRGRSSKIPRPDVITVDTVQAWISVIYGKTIETARGSEGALSASFLRLLLQTGEMLLRPDFLSDYNRELSLHPQLANGLQPTADMGAALITKWNVDEILLPAHGTLATFAVPLFAPSDGTQRRRPDTTLTLRSRLDWAALGAHSQYLLMCTRCHTPQGPRNVMATPRANVPSIGKQIEAILGPSRTIPVSQPRGLPKQPGIFVQDELWGHLMPNIGPGDYGRRRPRPFDTSLAGLLDAVTGISGYLPALPQWFQNQQLDDIVERLRPVAAVLRKLRCVRCDRTNVIRYLPRILMPIDLDLSADEHANRARRRTERLHRARTFVLKRSALSNVLWIPPMHDPGELLETIKALFDLLDRSGAKPTDDATSWRVAIWTQMAVTRKRSRVAGSHWESLVPKILNEFARDEERGRVEADLRALPGCVANLRRSNQAVERACAIFDAIMKPKHRPTRDLLRRYCEVYVFTATSKYRRGSQPTS